MRSFSSHSLAVLLLLAPFALPAEPEKEPLPKGALARMGSGRLRQISACTCVAFTPDSKLLAVGSVDGIVRLWDFANGKVVGELKSCPSSISVMRITPDGKSLAAGTSRGQVCVWDVPNLKRRYYTKGFEDQFVTCMAISPEGKTVYVGGNEGEFQVWDVGKPEEKEPAIRTIAVFDDVAVTPDGKNLVVSEREALGLWDLGGEKQVLAFDVSKEQDAVRRLSISSDGKLLFGANKKSVTSWDMTTGKKVKTYSFGAKSGIHALSANGRFIAVVDESSGTKVKFFGTASDSEVRSVSVPDVKSIDGIAYSPDGKWLAVAARDQCVRVLDVAQGKWLSGGTGPCAAVTALDFLPDGKHVISLDSGILRVWNEDGTELKSHFTGVSGTSVAMAVLREKESVLFVSSMGMTGSVRVADLLDGKGPIRNVNFPPELTPPNRGGSLRAFGLSADGRVAAGILWPASIRERSQIYWLDSTRRMITKNIPMPPPADDPEMTSDQINNVAPRRRVALSPDGKYTAIYLQDGIIHLWDLNSGTVNTGSDVRQITNVDVQHVGPWPALEFSPDGRALLTADSALRLVERYSSLERWRVYLDNPAMAFAFSHDGRLIAVGHENGAVSLRLATTGEELKSFDSGSAPICGLKFSADASRLVSAAADCTMLVWDTAEQAKAAPREAVKLDKTELTRLWHELLSADAGKAWVAMERLGAGGGDSVAFLKGRLKMPAPANGEFAGLVADLYIEDTKVREEAAARLRELCAPEVDIPAESYLQKLLENKDVTLQGVILVDQILDRRHSSPPPPRVLRALRTIEVLERIGTPEAAEVLETFAKDNQDFTASTILHEARAAISRIDKTAEVEAKPR